MNIKISDSIKFLLAEYERLKEKQEVSQLEESEEEALKNLIKFLGKDR